MDNKHYEDENNKNNENANIIQKLFEVVDKFTENVTRLENLSFENNHWKCIKYNINTTIENDQWKRSIKI